MTLPIHVGLAQYLKNGGRKHGLSQDLSFFFFFCYCCCCGLVVVVAVTDGRGGYGWCCGFFLGSRIYYFIVLFILFYCVES